MNIGVIIYRNVGLGQLKIRKRKISPEGEKIAIQEGFKPDTNTHLVFDPERTFQELVELTIVAHCEDLHLAESTSGKGTKNSVILLKPSFLIALARRCTLTTPEDRETLIQKHIHPLMVPIVPTGGGDAIAGVPAVNTLANWWASTDIVLSMDNPNSSLIKVFRQLASFHEKFITTHACNHNMKTKYFKGTSDILRVMGMRGFKVTRQNYGELKGLRGFRESTIEIVREYIEEGKCDRLQILKDDKKSVALQDLCEVFTIGPKTAYDLYNA
jgi:hypothetical protein